MSELRSASPSSRLDWVDALRGWAVLGVVAVHAGQLARCTGLLQTVTASGEYGVQLFFFVSAITISLTYDSHIARFGNSARSQVAWMLKRFFRIAPLYYFAACVYPLERLFLYVQTNHQYGYSTPISAIRENLIFIHTWIPSANNSVVPGGWSIGVEMFFYLLVPFLWLVRPVRLRITFFIVASAVLLALTFFTAHLSTGTFRVEDNSYLYYWFPTQAPTIFIGLIAYLLFPLKKPFPQSTKATALYSSGFILAALLAIYLGTYSRIAPALSPVILGIALIFLTPCLAGRNNRFIANPFAVFLGRISFSVYIFHFFVLDFFAVFAFHVLHIPRSTAASFIGLYVIVLGVTIVLARLSKRFIEDPAIDYGHKLSSTLSTSAQVYNLATEIQN